MRSYRAHKSGFTLVEILIVVIILGILAAIVIPQFTNASTAAKTSAAASTAQTLRSQVALYKLQHGDKLPGTGSGTTFSSTQFWTDMTTQTDGAIGYVEYAYAKQNKMSYADLVNKDGKAVAPSADTFQAAASNADWSHAPSYYLILTDQEGAKSWPITGASFILVYGVPQDVAATTEALKFFNWAYKKGTQMAAELDYVPLPAALIKQVQATWKSEIKGIPAMAAAAPAASKQM